MWIPDRTNRAFINKDWLSLYPGADRPARKTNQVPLPRGMEVQLMAAWEKPGIRRVWGIDSGSHPQGPAAYWRQSRGRCRPPPSSRRKTPRTANWSKALLPQIDRAFENMKLFMKAAGGSDADINHVWVFMKDFTFQPPMVERWVRDYPTFGNRPARKTLPYELGGDSQIQVQLSGYLGAKRKNYEVPGIGHDDPIPMGSSIGPLLQSSGMFGIDPKTGKRVEGLEAQLGLALRNIGGLLEQAGTTPDRVAHLTVMLQDYADAPRILEALRQPPLDPPIGSPSVNSSPTACRPIGVVVSNFTPITAGLRTAVEPGG